MKITTSTLKSSVHLAFAVGWLALGAIDAAVFSQEPGTNEDDGEFVNTVRWTTVGEVANFGFDVYRAESEEGPFERISPEPIAGADTTSGSREYHFDDHTIDPHKAYWYYVESLALNGVRQKFTPIFRAKPKLEEQDLRTADSEPPKL